ncbi:phosphatidylglycerol lysyltransferase domain-containing protein [Lachnospiraceae bacterium 62-35]
MKLEFKPVEARDMTKIVPYIGLRPNKSCDSVFLDSFLWKEYYQVRYAISDGEAVQWLMERGGKPFSALPMCKEEALEHYFYEMVEYFNQVLHAPFRVRLADEEGVERLNLDPSEFRVTEQEDLKDYLYDGEALRTLSGKKLHKKKNNINAFMREYEGRYEYRKLGCENRDEIWKFLDRWREQKGEEVEKHLDYEVHGIHEVLRACALMNNIQMGGIYIDNRLEAFTIGSRNPRENMAVIHIEKANPEIRGLYQYINREFLIHEFPQVDLVNREDDLGIEGLRKAKMSYNPIGFEKKYNIEQIIGCQAEFESL